MLSCLSCVEGQEMRYPEALGKAFLITNKKGFRGQYMKGKRNGMGLLNLKKGNVYIGDFYRDDITGIGMLVSSKKDEIENCKGCAVYVGNWRMGKKEGMGICYDDDGNILYQGKFIDDKPVEPYPSEDIISKKHFLQIELNNGGFYLGETNEGHAEGLGMIAFEDGDIWLGTFKEGLKKGIGLYMYSSGEWETLNYRNAKYTTVSSSDNYRMLDAIKKQNVRAGLNEALLGISSALEDFSARMGATNGRTNTNTDEMTIQDVGGSYGGSTASGSSSERVCPSCQGTGKCSTQGVYDKYRCHGSGRCQHCSSYATQSDYGNTRVCSTCNGTKKCHYCGGSGNCSTCGGTGKR